MFSLGSHGQVDFEQAVRARYPHCRIFVYDHTLDDKQRAAVLAVNGELSTECGHAGVVAPCAIPPCAERAWTSTLNGNQSLHHVGLHSVGVGQLSSCWLGPCRSLSA